MRPNQVGILCTVLRVGLVTLVMSQGSYPASARSAESAEDRRVCEALADRVQVSHTQSASVLRGLSKPGGGFVRLDAGINLGTESEAEEKLRRLLQLPKEYSLSDISENSFVSLKRLGRRSSVVAAETVGGTGACQQFWFFDVSIDGSAKLLPPPEEFDESSYCWASSAGASASLGTIGHVPTFAVENFSDGNESIHLIRRAKGAWSPFCRMDISWPRIFKVDEEFCQGSECPGLAGTAVDLARQFDLSGNLDEYWDRVRTMSPPDGYRDHFADYIRARVESDGTWEDGIADGLLENAVYRTIDVDGHTVMVAKIMRGDHVGWFAVWAVSGSSEIQVTDLAPYGVTDHERILAELPTFGSSPKMSFTGFDPDDSIVAPVQFGDRLLLARVGHGYRGWHKSDDYLFGLFAPDGAEMAPVAGMVISRSRGPNPTVKIN